MKLIRETYVGRICPGCGDPLVRLDDDQGGSVVRCTRRRMPTCNYMEQARHEAGV